MINLVVRIIIGLAAALVTGLAVALAWASSVQRATTENDQRLLACIGVVIVLAVHMLPVLRRRVHPLALWMVWLLCFLLAGFGHASWFYRAAESAAEVRQSGSAAARAAAQERAAIEQALGAIRARPVAIVAAQLARTTDDARREALSLELAEARRAAGLRDRLILLSGYAPGTGQVHPSTHQVHPVPGEVQVGAWLDRGATLAAAVVGALLLEVLGSLLWSVALAGGDDDDQPERERAEPVQHVVQQVVNVLAPIMSRPAQASAVDVVDDLADLRAAIERGECRPTVRGIREFMGVGSARAAQIKQQLIDH